ncbi:MAG TPA: hypothetical protein ENK77_04520, partial [Epsilonproteobacteria bacterium]|nr:hypothetical protein [Campylobacterota bacterium]
MRRTIAWITPIIFLVFAFNSCGGGGGFNTQRPDAIKEVKATCINDYHSLADANKGFSLCIEKVNEEECQKLTEPDADFMVKSYLINPACLEAGFPADSLTEGTNVKIYTLRRPLNADEAVIIGGQNTSATSVAMYGDKKIHIDTPNGVTVDMKRHNTNDKITKITVHNPNETTSLLSLDETHVVTLLDLKFDSFKPDDFGLTAFDFSPTLTIPNDLVSGYDTRTLSVFRISDRMIDGEIVTAYASNLPITITENGDLTVKDFYFSDSIASSLQYAKTSRSTVSGPNQIRYVLGTFSDSINWKRTPRLYHMHIDPEASAGRSGDPYGSVGNIQN